MPTDTLDITADEVLLQCRHIRPDGRRCGSPSLRARNFCYHHDLTRRPGPRQPQVNTARAAKANTFTLPTPADLSERAGLQLAVGQILHKIANNEIDPRRAGLLLYGLQIASTILPKPTKAEAAIIAEIVEEVIEDPELGALAPEAEWSEPETRGRRTIERWISEMEEESAADKAKQEARKPWEHNLTNTPDTPEEQGQPTTFHACTRPNRAQRRAQHRKLRTHIPPAVEPPTAIAKPDQAPKRNANPSQQIWPTTSANAQRQPLSATLITDTVSKGRADGPSFAFPV